jgi:hypothetical protein
LELAFDTSRSTITRDGHNLVFVFQEDTRIILEGFYDNFGNTASRPPVFIVEGMKLPGEFFLASLREPDLMPVAGPADATLPGERRGGGSVSPQGVGCIDRLGKFIFQLWTRREGTVEGGDGNSLLYS